MEPVTVINPSCPGCLSDHLIFIINVYNSEEDEEKQTYIVTVEGVEDSGDVAAQDANRDAGVVQCHPAAAGFL